MPAVAPRPIPSAVALAAALLLAWAGAAPAVPPGLGLDPDPSFALPGRETAAVEVGSASLIENARSWNGRRVSFTGEAVGEGMRRGDMAWIHVNDDAYMWKNIEEGAKLSGYNSGQAVWLAARDMRRVTFYGGYKHEGDVARVVGVFHAACPEHGGDMDIHAESLEIVRTGHPVDPPLNRSRLVWGLALMLLSALLYLAKKMAERRRI